MYFVGAFACTPLFDWVAAVTIVTAGQNEDNLRYFTCIKPFALCRTWDSRHTWNWQRQRRIDAKTLRRQSAPKDWRGNIPMAALLLVAVLLLIDGIASAPAQMKPSQVMPEIRYTVVAISSDIFPRDFTYLGLAFLLFFQYGRDYHYHLTIWNKLWPFEPSEAFETISFKQ